MDSVGTPGMNVNDKTASFRSPLEHSKVIPQCKRIMLLVMSSFLEYLGHILILPTQANIKSNSTSYRAIRLNRKKILGKHGNRSRSVLIICNFLSHCIYHFIFKCQGGTIHSLFSKFFSLLMSTVLISYSCIH